MWCYQKPGFKTLLMAELRRQQECSQYCDILLKAKDASVFAHSCVLSAVSPLLSSALSTMPLLPAGTRQPVEFQDLDAQMLHHMVELLYSGEMAGEGEWEREEALSMAARLGIDGLEEVRRSDGKQRPQGGVGHCTEAVVQTSATEVEAEVQTSATEVETALQTTATEVEAVVQTSATEVEAAMQTTAMKAVVQTSVTEVEAEFQTSATEVEAAMQTTAKEVEAEVQTSATEVEAAMQTTAMKAVMQTTAMEVVAQTSVTEVNKAMQTSATEETVQTSVLEVAVQTSPTEVEVAVQTEPKERQGGCTRWRREVRDGVTLLWKETESSGGRDTWTQTEELPILKSSPPPPPTPPPPPHPAASFQTIDINSLQTLGQTNSQLVPTEFVPVSIVYNESQWAHTSSAPSVPVEESTQFVGASAPFSLLYSGHAAPYGAEPHAGLTALQAAEEMNQEHLEQFQGNIPGFISHFLNPDMEGGPRGRRAGRRRRVAAGTAGRRAGTAGRSRQRAARGRGRGALTQTVDVQEVSAAGRLQTLYLQRLGGRLCRSGQGGAAAGRKVRLKTREMLNSSTAQQKKRVRSKVWQLDPTGDLQLCSGRGRGRGRRCSGQQVRKNAAPQAGSSASRTPRSRNQLSSPESSSQPPVCVYDVTNALPAALHYAASPATSFLSPAVSLLHTCPLPAAAPLPHDEQPDHIDRLLEEVMMGLDIFPKSSGAARPTPVGGGGGGCSRTPTRDRQCCLSSPEVGGSTGGEVCVLRQVSEGGANKILDRFLQSYERYVNSEEEQKAGESGAEASPPRTGLGERKRSLSPRAQNAGAPQPVGRPRAAKERSGQTQPSPSRPRRARRAPKQYPLSLEKKRVKLKMAVTIPGVSFHVSGRAEKQLQQIPVVKLRRSPYMPVSVSLRDLEAQDPARMEVSPAVKNSKGSLPEEYLQLFAGRKMYPIRSRLMKKSLIESCSFIDKPLRVLEEPVKKQRRLPAGWPRHGPGRPRKNPASTDGEKKVNRESNVQAQKGAEKPGRRKKKSSRGPGEDVTATKKVCLENAVQPSRGEPATVKPEEAGDGRTCPLRAAGRSQEGPRGTERRLADADAVGEKESRPPEGRTSPPPRSVHTKPWVSPWRSVREPDEDVDVIGVSSPAPAPVTISWTDASEEEDVDVIGEK